MPTQAETPARFANEAKYAIGQDLCVAFELADAEEAPPYVPVDVEKMTETERHEFNARMFPHYYG